MLNKCYSKELVLPSNVVCIESKIATDPTYGKGIQCTHFTKYDEDKSLKKADLLDSKADKLEEQNNQVEADKVRSDAAAFRQLF